MMLSNHPEIIAPGGLDPERFDPLEAWYPIAYVKDLTKDRPFSFTLLDRDLAIWWDRNSHQWQAFSDRCPHRLARLSEGRIAEDGLLECPYHGWAFTGEGKCDRLPQQLPTDRANTSKRACVDTFAAVERQGLLFIYPGTPSLADPQTIPIIPAIEDDPSAWLVMDTFRDLPYDASTLLENVLDPSHLPYTHHGSVGKRENAAPVELQTIESNKSGFKGVWPEGPRKGKLGTQYTTFIAPCLMWHELNSKQLGRALTVVYATPIQKGKCRIFARFPFQFASKIPGTVIKLTPAWLNHINNNAILEDDQIFLHHQERYLEELGGSEQLNKAFYLPTKADLFVFEFHQWWQRYQADPFPGQILDSSLDRETLLERYHSHTKHCASCSRAHRRFQQLKRVSAIFGIGCLLTVLTFTFIGSSSIPIPLFIAIASGIPISGLARFIAARQIDRLERGHPIPARNR
jgi:phenylpropionate dioxygenase-like ring-hydroxylating dioxygenase large terminal subunit